MLILERSEGEEVVLTFSGQEITVKVYCCKRGRVKLAITAPEEVRIVRKELIRGER